MIYGYARVSTQDQDLAAQIDALTAAGCEVILREKVSGAARENRTELRELIGSIQRGDVVIVSAIDRLARSSRDLHNILHDIETRGAQFKSLRESWADTSSPQGRLFVAILAAIAEMERDMIRARTDEGRKRAKAEGRSCGGPKPKLTAIQRVQAGQRAKNGEGLKALAAEYGVSASTIDRLRKVA